MSEAAHSDQAEKREGRLVVLASGSGTNLQAILDACSDGSLAAHVVGVISDQASAYALERARKANVTSVYLPWKPYSRTGRTRQDYDATLAGVAAVFKPDLVILAGWMRLLSMAFLERFPMRVVNLHPALPGTFPGTHAIQRAWDAYHAGEIEHTGVMVHLVPDEGVDNGPLIAQEVVPILPEETVEDLERRIHDVEHRLLVQAIQVQLDKINPV